MADKAAANLVHQTTTGTGTGNLTLSTVNGKQSFNTAFGNGVTTNVFVYFISNQGAAEWEYGTGHMSDATTLVRDTVIASTNSNTAVSFSAGTKDVSNDVPAASQVQVDLAQTLTNKTINASNNTVSNLATSMFAANVIDTDGTLAANSDTRIASQKAVKTYAQPLDADLTTIAGLTPTTNNFMQAKSSAWASRTPTQVTADLDAVVGDSGSGGTKGLVPAPGAGDAAANKYLKANGAWATVSAGGGSIVWISTNTASSSATLDFTSLDTTTYVAFMLSFRNIIPATNSVKGFIRVGTGGTPTYQATSYINTRGGATTGIGFYDLGGTENTLSNTSANGISGSVTAYNLGSSSAVKMMAGTVVMLNSDSGVYSGFCGGNWNSNTAVTALRFLFSSGNIASGSIDLYGLKAS